MAEKDTSEKILESYNDVFADIVNVLLFHGEEILKPDELEDQAPRSYYKADGKIRELERDVAKRWKSGNIRIACIGLENQTEPDPDMPLRVIGYDGAEYRAQLLAGPGVKSRYPVVTLVLYFGHKAHWSAPTSLLERITVPEQFKPYVNDYKINLFEISYLTSEQLGQFKSDFKVVADYFVQKRENDDYTPSPQILTHVQETLQLLSVMSGDYRFEEVYSSQAEGGPHTMCDVLDRVENRGLRQGVKQGEDAFAALIQKLFSLGRTEDVKRAAEDQEYRHALMKEFSIPQ